MQKLTKVLKSYTKVIKYKTKVSEKTIFLYLRIANRAIRFANSPLAVVNR